MTKRDVLSISFKVLAVVCIVRAATWLPGIGIQIDAAVHQWYGGGYNPYWGFAASILSWILLLLIAFFLLRHGDWISERLVPEDTTLLATVTDVRQGERSSFILSVKVIGVVCLIKGLPQLASGLADLAGRGSLAGWGLWYLSARFVGAIVLLILGAYLISGGKHLVKFAFPHPQGMPPLDDINRDEPY